MTTYVEGPWLAWVTPRSVAMLADAPSGSISDLVEALDARGLSGFIDMLADATGTTASSLPDFAVALAEDRGIRVAVRGASTITQGSGGAGASLSGMGVTGWAEAVWETAASVELVSPATPTGATLWVVEGAVRAASISWSPMRGRAAAAAERQLPSEKAPSGAVPEAPAAPEPSEPPTRSDDVSLDTLAPEYDTVGTDATDTPYDTVFGSLWGATSSAPAPRAAGGSPMISAVPDFTSPPVNEAPEPATAQPPASAPEAASSQPTASAPEAASPAPPPPPPPAPPASGPTPEGDHDGATVSIAALRAMTSAPPSADSTDASVPTFASADQLAKEKSGRAVVSTGAVVTLDKNVIIGRTPKASRVTGEMPHLITVPSPSQDISRSHLELRVEGTAVVAVDLHTTNGTLVKRPGTEPVRLHPGEPHVLLSGDVIDLGDGVTITMEDLP